MRLNVHLSGNGGEALTDLNCSLRVHNAIAHSSRPELQLEGAHCNCAQSRVLLATVQRPAGGLGVGCPSRPSLLPPSIHHCTCVTQESEHHLFPCGKAPPSVINTDGPQQSVDHL